jgi:hypothetical protein
MTRPIGVVKVTKRWRLESDRAEPGATVLAGPTGVGGIIVQFHQKLGLHITPCNAGAIHTGHRSRQLWGKAATARRLPSCAIQTKCVGWRWITLAANATTTAI